MKKIQIITLLFLSIILLLGCKKWKEPEFVAPEWNSTGITAKYFYTIGGKKIIGKHKENTAPDLIVHPSDTYEYYVRAVVVSSDEGGNFYKAMTIQDTTGGVELQLDMAGLYNFYPVGQKIVLVCNAANKLVIGDYNSLPQIGWEYKGNQVGRINSLHLNKFIIKDGLPNPKYLPKPLTNDEIDFTGTKDINKLVRLEGVKFSNEAIGKPLAFNDFTTEWKIKVPLQNGTTSEVIVRTSNYAKFRNTIIEDKEYNLTGILTTFKTKKQLMIRTKEDIEFTYPEGTVIFDFTTSPLGEGKWSNKSLLGSTQWVYRSNSMFHPGNKQYAAYQVPMDDWLISPIITCLDYKTGYMRFEHELPVSNAVYDPYQVYYTTTTSPDFNKDDWKLLGTIGNYPNKFFWSFKLPLAKIGSNTFRIAFRYYAPNKDIEAYDWKIRTVEIR